MSAVESFRHLINERLAAAAEEILGVFAQTVSVYEEELSRQRKLLDVLLQPEIKLHRTELPQQHVCKEKEVLTDQQLCNQERNASLDQEDPEPPLIKEEQKKLSISLEGEQLVLKQEDDFLESSPNNLSDHSEDWTLVSTCDQNHSADNISTVRIRSESDRESFAEIQPNTDHQLLFRTSYEANNQDHESDTTKPKKKHEGTSTSTRNIKPNIVKEENDQKQRTYSLENTGSTSNSKPKLNDQPFKCNSCGKKFYLYTQLKVHMKTHTCEKPFSCTVCGKQFSLKRYLTQHMTTHSGEKPYTCSRCRKSFRRLEHMQIHMRSHTGEKPYSCAYCEKAFSTSSALAKHVRLHRDEKPYNCRGEL